MLRLQEITKDAVHDPMVMEMASTIYHNRDTMSSDEFAHALFQYSGLLSSLTTTLAITVLMTEEQVDEMASTIKEFEQLGKENN
jgi:hypothetical protein